MSFIQSKRPLQLLALYCLLLMVGTVHVFADFIESEEDFANTYADGYANRLVEIYEEYYVPTYALEFTLGYQDAYFDDNEEELPFEEYENIFEHAEFTAYTWIYEESDLYNEFFEDIYDIAVDIYYEEGYDEDTELEFFEVYDLGYEAIDEDEETLEEFIEMAEINGEDEDHFWEGYDYYYDEFADESYSELSVEIQTVVDTVRNDDVLVVAGYVYNFGDEPYDELLRLNYSVLTDDISTIDPASTAIDGVVTAATYLAPGDSSYFEIMLPTNAPLFVPDIKNVVIVWPVGTDMGIYEEGDLGYVDVYVSSFLDPAYKHSETIIALYPNPTTDFVYMTNAAYGESDITSLLVCDLQGRVLQQHNNLQVAGATIQIDMREELPGIYLIHAITANEQFVEMIMKE